MSKFCIGLFGHTRPVHIGLVLESLKRQDALGMVHVWLDGHQWIPSLKQKTEEVRSVVAGYPVGQVKAYEGHIGFRKLFLHALDTMSSEYDHLLILEDDCFPTRNAVRIFREELEEIETRPEIFSVYGHPFLVEAEGETCARFQGWGWATTREKLRPILEKLVDCFSMSEEQYLEFVKRTLTPEIISRIDVTPPRQPSYTLQKFFAWDETTCLLTALEGLCHKKTSKRTIYNFGIDSDAGHFQKVDLYRGPAFNMISPKEVWSVFDDSTTEALAVSPDISPWDRLRLKIVHAVRGR